MLLANGEVLPFPAPTKSIKAPRFRSQRPWMVSRYPGVIITRAHYLGPPGPSTSQILGTSSRFSEDCPWQRERPLREDPHRVREDPLGTPPLLSLCQDSL